MSISTGAQIDRLWRFLGLNSHTVPRHLTAVSLFSGGGISDLGYRAAGFEFLVQSELEKRRAALGQANFPDSIWVCGDIREKREEVINTARHALQSRRLDLLSATPPCQGMSSSNPGRGKRQDDSARRHEVKNRLVLEVAPVAIALEPRIIVIENVPQLRTLQVLDGQNEIGVLTLLRRTLGKQYAFFDDSINVANYGIPQQRRRAVIVGIHRQEPWLDALLNRTELPWPSATHGPSATSDKATWVTVREWLETGGYEPLDASSVERSIGSHRLHFVPSYDAYRYRMLSDIPSLSGQSAYHTTKCPHCGFDSVPLNQAICNSCGGAMFNKPIVKDENGFRLIKGFQSSYRRMHPNEPAATITTASNHIGSDYKIHPWENRLLSLLECADLQTVPRCYDWSLALVPPPHLQLQKKPLISLIREIVGEAFPSYFTYLHGLYLAKRLEQDVTEDYSNLPSVLHKSLTISLP